MSTLWDSDSMGDFGFSLKLGFDADDLLANREGKLSKGQQRKLRNGLIWIPILMIAFVVGTWTFFPRTIKQTDSTPLIIVFILLCVGIFVVIWALVALDLQRAKAYSIEGQVKHVVREIGVPPRRSKDFLIKIVSREFRVSPSVQHAFEEGQTYRIYYLSQSNTILSAERL